MGNYQSAFTGAQHDAYVTKEALINLIYPVGSIYISTNSTSPATLFGGSWSQIQGQFLLASSSRTVNLATDGTNPTAYIALRILNDWSGANGRSATIHHISLREVTTLTNEQLLKTGVFKSEEFIESQKASIQQNKIIKGKTLIEI